MKLENGKRWMEIRISTYWFTKMLQNPRSLYFKVGLPDDAEFVAINQDFDRIDSIRAIFSSKEFQLIEEGAPIPRYQIEVHETLRPFWRGT